MEQHPRLKKERLFLRKLALRDVEEIFSSCSQDPEVSRYLLWEPHQNKQSLEHP